MYLKNNINIISFGNVFGFMYKRSKCTRTSLIRIYKYKSVKVTQPIDIDKDGLVSYDLMKEKGKECVWDNTWQYQGNKATLRAGERLCGSQEADNQNVIGSFDYIYEKVAKTIKITYEGGITEVLNNVKIGYTSDQKQFLSFELWDNDLSQSVTYYLVSH